MSKISLTNEQLAKAITAGCWVSLEEDSGDIIYEAIQESIGEQFGMKPDQWLYDDDIEEATEKIYYAYKDFIDKFWAWAQNKGLEKIHEEIDMWIKDNLKRR